MKPVRALKPEEKDLHDFTIAGDGLAIIVHKDNPLTALTRDQVAKIYRHQINSWSELGGPDKKITLVHKAEGRSTLELFLKFMKLSNSEVKADVIVGDNEQGLKTVAGNPSAIGYVSIGAAIYAASQGQSIKLLDTDGVKPTLENVGSGVFPMTRQLNLVTKNDPKGLASDFINFALSPENYDIIRAQYFVPPPKK